MAEQDDDERVNEILVIDEKAFLLLRHHDAFEECKLGVGNTSFRFNGYSVRLVKDAE